MSKIIFKKESYEIVGACFEVYKSQGCGFLEPVYHECLLIELERRSIPFVSKPSLELEYKGNILEHTYEPDFICYGKVILEIKAVRTLADIQRAQVINYAKVTNFELAILINFGHYPKLEYERFGNVPGYRDRVGKI